MPPAQVTHGVRTGVTSTARMIELALSELALSELALCELWTMVTTKWW